MYPSLFDCPPLEGSLRLELYHSLAPVAVHERAGVQHAAHLELEARIRGGSGGRATLENNFKVPQSGSTP